MTTILILIITTLMLPLTLLVVGRITTRSGSGRQQSGRTLKRAIVTHALIFGVLYVGVLIWGINHAYAGTVQVGEETTVAVAGSLSVGDGLAMLAVALATGMSILGAGYAVGLVGSSALGVIAEKPELFGRTLVIIGLAEGLAIYGLVLSIMILGRL